MLTHYEQTRTFALTTGVLGIGFSLGALAHALGFIPPGTLDAQPRLIAPVVLDAAAGLLLLAAAFALARPRAGAFRSALGANLLALIGVIAGVISLAFTSRESAGVNVAYDAVLLALLVFNVVGLWRVRPRNPVKRAGHRIASHLY